MKKVLWFRRDLRVDDSMLLATEGEVLPIFIFDTNILNTLEKDDKRVSFIFEQVTKLKAELQALGLDLAIFYGRPLEVFTYLKTLGCGEVYASVDYDSYARKRDEEIAELLSFHSLNDCYLFEPMEVLKKDGTPYLVFTPYYRACKELYTKFYVLEYKRGEQSLSNFDYSALWSIEDGVKISLPLDTLGFEYRNVALLSPQKVLETFAPKIDKYAIDRDYLDIDATSYLSVHLRFGTISIREVVRFLVHLKAQGHETEPFFRQLIFREFYAYLLYHFPKLAWERGRHGSTDRNQREARKIAQQLQPVPSAGKAGAVLQQSANHGATPLQRWMVKPYCWSASAK